MSIVRKRLRELGIVLPAVGPANGTYVPYRKAGNLLFISGQVPRVDGRDAHLGVLGGDMDIAQGYEAARICATHLLARVDQALDGDLDRVVACVQLRGFVNALPEFHDHPKVIDGASDLLVAVLGNAGQHARTALGAGSLPRGFAVEIDAIFEIRT